MTSYLITIIFQDKSKYSVSLILIKSTVCYHHKRSIKSFKNVYFKLLKIKYSFLNHSNLRIFKYKNSSITFKNHKNEHQFINLLSKSSVNKFSYRKFYENNNFFKTKLNDIFPYLFFQLLF